MIAQSSYPVEPRTIRETELDLNLLAQSESVFALSNGHIGLRGNLDEASRTASRAPTCPAFTNCGRCRTQKVRTPTPNRASR
jgi:trehalose/maltose hydrolase-like predicted phosphorylase